MDGFTDKFAQRKTAQEMIRANAMAEAEEKEKIQAQLAEYEKAMREIRRCSLQNIENAEKVRELLTAGLSKIEEVQKKDDDGGKGPEKWADEIKEMLRELTQAQEKIARELTQTQEKIAQELTQAQEKMTRELTQAQEKGIKELLSATEDFIHKESVKVYRNVQAVIEGALPKQTEEITEAVKKEMDKKGSSRGLIVVWALTFVAALANVAIEALRLLGYL